MAMTKAMQKNNNILRKNTFLGTETKLFSDPFLIFFSVGSGKIVFNFWNRSQMLLEVLGDARQRRRKCTDFMFIGRHHQFPQTFNLYFPPRFQCSLKKTGAKILWVKPGKSTASTLSANIVFHFRRRRMEPAAHIYYTTFPAFKFQTCLEIVKSQPNYAQFQVSRAPSFKTFKTFAS